MFALNTSHLQLRYDGGGLSCANLNVTVHVPAGPELWCPGAELAYSQLDPRGSVPPPPPTPPPTTPLRAPRLVPMSCPKSSLAVLPSSVPGYDPTPGAKLDTWQDITRGPVGNLNGSLDTMDCYVMAEACIGVYQGRMQKGLFSREGWAVVDDSATALWDGDPSWEWRTERVEASGRDLYFLGFGHDYRGGMQEFTAISGRSAFHCLFAVLSSLFTAVLLQHPNDALAELRRLVQPVLAV